MTLKTSARSWLLLVLLPALLLRLWNIHYPAWKVPDEQFVIDRALLLGHEGPNPHWFAYPSFFLYILFATDAAFYLAGRLLGIFVSPEDFARFYFAHPLPLHLIGRSLAMVFGLASLVVIFRIGRHWWGYGVGLAATGLLAVSPLHLFFSRLAKPDMLMVLLLLVAAFGVCRYLDANGAAWLWTAGLAVGLATSTKYPAAAGVIWLVAAPLLRRRGRLALAESVVAVSLAVVGFVAGTPFALLDWSTFRTDFAFIAAHMRRQWYGAEDTIGYTFYLFHGFPEALGWPAAALGLAGCGRWLLRGGPREQLLAGFVVAFYSWMGYSQIVGAHYLFPTYPIVALAAADLLKGTTARLRTTHATLSRWAFAGVAAVCLLPLLTSAVRETLFLAARDTRELGAAWIAEHFAPGTRVLSEPGGPFLSVVKGRLDEMIDEGDQRWRGRGMRMRFERDSRKPGEGFWYYEMPLFSDQFVDRPAQLLSRPAVEEYNLDRFLNQGYRVVVLSSAVYDRYRRLPERYPIQNAFFSRVSRDGTLLARVDSSTPWCCPDTLNTRLSEAAARVWGRPGPTLLIYRLSD